MEMDHKEVEGQNIHEILLKTNEFLSLKQIKGGFDELLKIKDHGPGIEEKIQGHILNDKGHTSDDILLESDLMNISQTT